MSPMRRNWKDARAKVVREGRCRAYRTQECDGPLETAHVIGREYDKLGQNDTIYVNPVSVVPLCRKHHHAYDRRNLDLLPYLNLEEQAYAARHLGLLRALDRTSGPMARPIPSLTPERRTPPAGGIRE